MSLVAYYTFYLESEQGLPAVGLTPSIESIKLIPGGDTVSVEGIQSTLIDLGDGLFQYEVDWSTYSNEKALFVKINTGLSTQDQRYLTTRIEKHDVLPKLVENIQSSANSLETSANLLKVNVEKILNIEEGSWIIEGTEFKIFNKSADLQTDDPIAVFELYDSQGTLNGENPTKRIAKNN